METGRTHLHRGTPLQSYLSAVLFVILAVSIFARFYHADQNFSFTNEQADDLFVVEDIWKDIWTGDIKHLPIRGQEATPVLANNTSLRTKLFHGVFYYYFLLPAGIVSGFDPVGVVLFLAVLGVFTVYFLFEIASYLFDRTTAIFTGAIAALSFWMVAYSRWIWTPSTIPFFVSLALFSWIRIRQGKEIFWYVLAFALGSVSQVHLSGSVFLFFLLCVVWKGRKYVPVSWSKKVFIIAFFILPLAPFLLDIMLTKGTFLTANFINAFANIFSDFIGGQSTIVQHLLSVILDIYIKFLWYIKYFFFRYLWHSLKIYGVLEEQVFLFGVLLGAIGTIATYLTNRYSIKRIPITYGQKLLSAWFFIFIPLPWGVAYHYGQSGHDLAIFNNLLIGVPFVILISAYVLRISIRYWYWIPLSISFWILFIYSNTRLVKESLWDYNSEYRYGALSRVASFIAHDAGQKHFDIHYFNPRVDKAYELAAIFLLSHDVTPERFNGTTSVGIDNMRVLPGEKPSLIYTVADMQYVFREIMWDDSSPSKPQAQVFSFGKPLIQYGDFGVFRKDEL